MIVCKNCFQELDSKFCPKCGQKASTKRFSTRILFSQLVDKLIPLDRGVLFTARQVLSRPGGMVREYLNGKRVGYTKPFQFLLIIGAISLIFFSKDDFQRDMAAGMAGSGNSPNAEIMKFQQQIVEFITSNMTLILVGMIPFLAWTGRWFYKKHEVNYAEHFVMNCYLLGACSIITMPFMLLFRLMGKDAYSSDAAAFFSVFYIGFYVWAHITFFKEPRRIRNGIKGMLTYLTAYLMYIIFIGMASVAGTVVYLGMIKAG